MTLRKTTPALVASLIAALSVACIGEDSDGSTADAGDSAIVDAAWSITVDYRMACVPNEPCQRLLEVSSDGTVIVTDPSGALNLSELVGASVIARWGAFAAGLGEGDCAWDPPTDFAEMLVVTASRSDGTVVVDPAFGCVVGAPGGSSTELGALLHESLEVFQDDLDCPLWVTGPAEFEGTYLVEETPRFACKPRF